MLATRIAFTHIQSFLLQIFFGQQFSGWLARPECRALFTGAFCDARELRGQFADLLIFNGYAAKPFHCSESRLLFSGFSVHLAKAIIRMTTPHSLPLVAVAALGGTIAMAGSAANGLVPALTAQNLLQAVPGAASLARIQASSLAGLPSASLQLADLLKVLAWAHQCVDDGCQAIIITQGTDTLEDSAYFFDLCWSRPVPVIFTAAMRGASATSADGPANLLAALQVATSADVSQKRQVMVLLNDTLHAPAFVTKSHTLALETFTSQPAGPLGTMVEGRPVFFRGLPDTQPLSALNWVSSTIPDTLPEVGIVATWPGDDGRLLRAAAEQGYGALVIQGLGAGHVSTPFARAVGDIVKTLPVVVSTRVPFGPVVTATYGYPGSEKHLQELGAIMAGWLSPQKARVAMCCLLASGLGNDPLRAALRTLAYL